MLGDEVFGGSDVIGICFTAEGHAIDQLNLLIGVGSCISNHAGGEVVGHGKDERIVHQRQGLQGRDRVGSFGSCRGWVGAVEGVQKRIPAASRSEPINRAATAFCRCFIQQIVEVAALVLDVLDIPITAPADLWVELTSDKQDGVSKGFRFNSHRGFSPQQTVVSVDL